MIAKEDFAKAIETINACMDLVDSIMEDIDHANLEEPIFSQETADLIQSVGQMIVDMQKRTDQIMTDTLGYKKHDA